MKNEACNCVGTMKRALHIADFFTVQLNEVKKIPLKTNDLHRLNVSTSMKVLRGGLEGYFFKSIPPKTIFCRNYLPSTAAPMMPASLPSFAILIWVWGVPSRE